MNDLDVHGAGVHNEYLNAENLEKVCMGYGFGFWELEGRKFIFKKALYGLNSVVSPFKFFIAWKWDEVEFILCVDDPYVWRSPEMKSDGTEYSEYFMTYVDKIIDVSIYAVGISEEISPVARIKNNKIYQP